MSTKFIEIQIGGENEVPSPLQEVIIRGNDLRPNKAFIDYSGRWWVFVHSERTFLNPAQHVLAEDIQPKTWFKEMPDKSEDIRTKTEKALDKLAMLKLMAVEDPGFPIGSYRLELQQIIDLLQ